MLCTKDGESRAHISQYSFSQSFDAEGRLAKWEYKRDLSWEKKVSWEEDFRM